MAISKVLTIEINEKCTKLCEIGYAKKNPCIYRSLVFDNPPQVIDDGFIVDRVAYGILLQDRIKESGIRCKNVVFTLASNKILTREIIVPEMKEKLIAEYIENEREEFFPMDTSNHVITYHILEHKKEEKQIRILVFAAPIVLVKCYQVLAEVLGLHIVAIDYNGNSIYQWLRKQNHERMDFYLQINERNTMFTILENNLLALQRNINFGTIPLVNSFIEGGYNSKIEPDAAMLALVQKETIYQSFSEMMNFVPEDDQEIKRHELKRRVTDTVRPLIGNLTRVLEYYNTRNRDAKVTKIHVGGIGAKVKGLKQLLENEFSGITFEIVEILPGINIAKDNQECFLKSTEFIACIGAAEKSIDFSVANKKQDMGKTLVLCIAALAMVVVLAVFMVWNGIYQYQSALKERDRLNEKINTLLDIETLEGQYNAAMAAVLELTDMDLSTYRYNEEWNEVLDYLESELPENTLVSSVSSNESGLTLNITVTSKNEAAKLLLQMKKIPYFKEVTINGLTEEVDTETGIVTVSFSVLCTYQSEKRAQNDEMSEEVAK